MNETRNQLLSLLHYVKGKEENKEFNLYNLLERFQYDLEDQLKDLESKKNEIMNNLDLLNYIKEELKEENRFIKNDLLNNKTTKEN